MAVEEAPPVVRQIAMITSQWFSGCRKYNACSVPVYFVTESWFVNVYLPAIGSRDGREQQYRIDAARERASDRDAHDIHGED